MSPRPPTDEATNDAAVASEDAGERAYRVKLPMFEGPLDLLLHLIQKHELNILDIPIGFVALKYVEYIRLMEEMSIDLASEYLVMAATLAHLKSRSLLPPDPTQEAEEASEDEEEEDPRAELIRKLLEYQKYKHAADTLGQREVLGRDTFARGFAPEQSSEEAPLAPMSLFKLVDAFESVLKRAKQVQEHQIDFEKVSITDRIGQIVERLRDAKTLSFEQLFDGDVTRAEMIVTFLALLEMTKLRMTRLSQDGPLEPIVVELALSAEQAKNFRAENAFEQVMEAVEQDFAHAKPKSVTNDSPAPWDEALELEHLSDEELAEELREAAEAFALAEGEASALGSASSSETHGEDAPDDASTLNQAAPPQDSGELAGDVSPGGQMATFGPPDDDFFDEDELRPSETARRETAFQGTIDEDDEFEDNDDGTFSLDDLREAARALAGDDWDPEPGEEAELDENLAGEMSGSPRQATSEEDESERLTDSDEEHAAVAHPSHSAADVGDDVAVDVSEGLLSAEPGGGDVDATSVDTSEAERPETEHLGPTLTWPAEAPAESAPGLSPEEAEEVSEEGGSEPKTNDGEADDEEDSQDRGESDVESR